MRNFRNHSRLVFFDVETTGLDPAKGHRIIEIGAIAMENNQLISEFQSLVHVSRPISRHVSKIHGITNDMLAGQPTPEQIYPEFKEFIDDSLLVAHNAGFDIKFLRYELARLGAGMSNEFHCTMKMSRKCFPQLPNHKLETVARHVLNELPEGLRLHRALNDARLTAMVWMEMIKR